MNNRELGFELGRLTREERGITNRILNLINLSLERRAYLEHGYPSMFEWLVKGFGYSNAAAYRRIEAARVLKAVPSVSEKLQAGKLNLTTLSKMQSAIKAQEKATGKRVSNELKTRLVEKIENKSTEDTERVLRAQFPELKSAAHQERKLVIDENITRHMINFSKEMTADLKRAKEILSHKFPQGSDAEILGYALKLLLDRMDPLRKSTSAAEAKRVTKVGTKRMIAKSTNGACSYKDPLTGILCGSRHQVQFDHIKPKALGGGDQPENIRLLCRGHNLHVAEKIFGKDQMDRYRRGHSSNLNRRS